MAILYCNWNNTAVAASSNVISQRLSWREKTLGGAFNTTSVTPSNDMSKTINSAQFTAATVNKVYEFKVEAICTEGGPTANLNGIVENIVFSCVTPEPIVVTTTTLNFHINIPSTDITKARLKLKKQSDNSLISTQIVNKVADAIDYTFTGLTASTGYYVEVEFYAVVNTVEVISSSVDYLGSSCGGNIIDYQISTIDECTEYSMVPDVGETLVVNFLRCADGVADSLGSINPYTVCAKTGTVVFSSGTGTITSIGPCV